MQLIQIALAAVTNLTGCYKDTTKVVLNRNIKQITVYLTPTKNESCYKFPKGVNAQLILYQEQAPSILQSKLNDFNYENTTSIVFDIIDDDDLIKDTNPTNPIYHYAKKDTVKVTADEKYKLLNYVDLARYNIEHMAVFRLETFAEMTQLQVFTFQEQRAALSDCFYPNSTAILDEDSNLILINLFPTRLCNMQICDDYQGQRNKLFYVTLTIGGVDFAIKPDKLKSYNVTPVGEPLIVTYEPDETLYEVFFQTMPQSKLTFQSGLTESSMIKFGHSISKTTRKMSQIEVSILIMTVSDAFYFILQYADEVARSDVGQYVKALSFDQVQYQFSAMIDGVVHSITMVDVQFDINTNFLVIPCSGETALECSAFYQAMQQDPYNQNVQAAIIFRNGADNQGLLSFQALYLESLWNLLKFRTRANSFTLDDAVANGVKNLDEIFSSASILNYSILLISQKSPNPQFSEVLQYQVPATSELKYIGCAETLNQQFCDQILEKLAQNTKDSVTAVGMLQTIVDGKAYCGLVVGVDFQDYTKATDLVVIVGVVFVAGILGYAIYLLVHQLRKIKMIKTKKLKFEGY